MKLGMLSLSCFCERVNNRSLVFVSLPRERGSIPHQGDKKKECVTFQYLFPNVQKHIVFGEHALFVTK